MADRRVKNFGKEKSCMSKVNLIATLNGKDLTGMTSTDLSVYGALGCFSPSTSLEMFEEDKDSNVEEKKEKVIQESAGRGHGAVLDQNAFCYSIKKTTRATTLLLCAPEYLMHLQQSLRRVKALDYHLPDALKNSSVNAKKVIDRSFETYNELIDSGVPEEDARNAIPLYTKTSIQSWGNARELMHLHSMSMEQNVPLETENTINQMIEEGKKINPKVLKRRETEYYDNYETLSWFPSSQLFARKNKTLTDLIKQEGSKKTVLIDKSAFQIDEEGIKKALEERKEEELANLKHVHFTFLSPMSLSAFHQATRQRTWNQSVEPIYSAVERGNWIVPPTVKQAGEVKKYLDVCNSLLGLYQGLVADGVEESEAIGVIPHALQVYDLIHVNGWNAAHAIAKRTCFEAQWEIRKKAMEMALSIKEEEPALGKYAEPQGRLFGECPESSDCNYCFTDTSMKELYDQLYGGD